MSVEEATNIVGLDFGSHAASIAIWNEEKNTVDVIADDLGSRTIPTAVAFRSMGPDQDVEIITGLSAISQQHKNTKNTFDDVRSYLMKPKGTMVNVPALEKEVSVDDIATHFFRNIHNQIKQQLGKPVRECVVSFPTSLDGPENEELNARIVESAKAGGMRIKSFISDTVATVLAYNFDDISVTSARGRTVVIDLGWSKCEVAQYNVSGGVIIPLSSSKSEDVSGSIFVKLLVEHCAKEFTRKTKCPFPEYSSNNKAVIRLKRECETAMKSLSIGAEAMIDIDSLYEGMDFSCKISRARYEDLLTIPIIQMKKMIGALLEGEHGPGSGVDYVCVSGGPSTMPKVSNTLKVLFPNAVFVKGKFELFEAQCIGAALHGKALYQQGLINSAPTKSASVTTLEQALLVSGMPGSDSPDAVVVVPVKTVIPACVNFKAQTAEIAGKNYLKIVMKEGETLTPIGELSFDMETEGDGMRDVNICFNVLETEISVEVTQVKTKLIVATLVIPSS